VRALVAGLVLVALLVFLRRAVVVRTALRGTARAPAAGLLPVVARTLVALLVFVGALLAVG
jgi:hypothetical protein